MPEVKWIKIVTDIFDDEKILLIESMPEADAMIVIWFKLLTLAGKINNGGVLLFNDKLPYTDEMLATIFRRPINTVRLAINTFEKFGMIEVINNAITIPNWSKHQTLDKLEQRNEYMKNYMREYREKQKLLANGNKVPENGLPIDEWIEVINYFNNECAYCGNAEEELEQEHIIPTNKGGKYIMGNIIPACRSCNSSKQDKDIFSWYKQQKFYDETKLNRIVNFCKLNNISLRKANVSEAEEDIEEDIDIDKKHISKKDIDSFFETIWKAYPKKEGKGSISDTQKKKLYNVGLDEMLRAVERYKKAKVATEKKYLQMGSTFFNSGYVDYLDCNYAQEKENKPRYEDENPFLNRR